MNVEEPDLQQHEGLRAMKQEMARQCADALATMNLCRIAAERIAARLRQEGRVILYGMGGSHHVNRIAEPRYLEAGIDCRAVTASDALLRPYPDCAAIVTSQSGESGEVVDLLALRQAGYLAAFTLDTESTLARAADDVIAGSGGPEVAFAATRSIIVTLAMHAAVLEALGIDQQAFRSVMAAKAPVELGAMVETLSTVNAVVFAGREMMDGVAASCALSLMELARIPAIAFETGQFRHGPLEMLAPDIGVVLLKNSSRDALSFASIVEACESAGCTSFVVDTSGIDTPGPGRIVLPQREGFSAAAEVLLTMQHFNIGMALGRISSGVGTPQRTTKITR